MKKLLWWLFSSFREHLDVWDIRDSKGDGREAQCNATYINITQGTTGTRNRGCWTIITFDQVWNALNSLMRCSTCMGCIVYRSSRCGSTHHRFRERSLLKHHDCRVLLLLIISSRNTRWLLYGIESFSFDYLMSMATHSAFSSFFICCSQTTASLSCYSMRLRLESEVLHPLVYNWREDLSWNIARAFVRTTGSFVELFCK